jgi:hypothetical protein
MRMLRCCALHGHVLKPTTSCPLCHLQVYHQHPGATAIVQRLGRIMVSMAWTAKCVLRSAVEADSLGCSEV